MAALAAVALLSVSACSKTGAIDEGARAADFSLNDIDGNRISLSDFKGKVIVLNFFATWCPPCRAEIPDFIRLESEHGAEGLAIIGVSNERVSDVRGFAEMQGINYTLLVDPGQKAFGPYGPIRAIPTTFIIDRDFNVNKKYVGARPGYVFETDIKELL